MSYVAVALSRVPLLPPAPPARTAAEWLWKHELQKKRRLKAEEDLPRAFCSRSFHRSRPPSRRGFDSPVVLFASSLGNQHRYNRRYVKVRNRRVARAVFPLRVCCLWQMLRGISGRPLPWPRPGQVNRDHTGLRGFHSWWRFFLFSLTLRSYVVDNIWRAYNIVTVIFPIVHLSSAFFLSQNLTIPVCFRVLHPMEQWCTKHSGVVQVGNTHRFQISTPQIAIHLEIPASPG